jgi:hypothetical protein
MAEVETPPVTTDDTKTLVLKRYEGDSMLERWIQTDAKAALEKINKMVEVLQALRKAAIRETYPSDWIIHVSRNADGEIIRQVGYLQDCGAERAAKPFGIQVGQPTDRREDFSDGTLAYHLEAEAWSRVTGERIQRVEGSRWSGDKFFQRQVKEAGDKVDPTDVSKAAYANLHGRAVRALAGLSAVPVDVLDAAGLDTKKCVFVDYEKGAKGGESTGAQVGSADVTVGFGNSKGKKVGELSDQDLSWYLKAYRENVADPKKERYQKQNQRVLDALTAEAERRAQAADHATATATGNGGETAGTETTEPGQRSRGQKLGDLQTRLTDACDRDQRKVAALLRGVTKELFGQEKDKLSDLSDEEIEKLNAIPEPTLKTVATTITTGGGGGKK